MENQPVQCQAFQNCLLQCVDILGSVYFHCEVGAPVLLAADIDDGAGGNCDILDGEQVAVIDDDFGAEQSNLVYIAGGVAI
ncbi:MAG: hypothetical protein NTX21_10770 [Alphaproteobacteria bacterium]|nr:hypothetical protein [Alphaproteobacteria bacterium]